MGRRVWSAKLLEENENGKSWQKIADELGAGKVKMSGAMAWRLAHDIDYEPRGKEIRAHLGMTISSMVVAISGLVVEDGSETMGSEKCLDCGNYFISNHWARQRCFSCSPYRGSKINIINNGAGL